PACALAVFYEGQGDLAKCETLLMPHASRLGDGEGARILGHLLAAQGKFGQASVQLQAYTQSRLARLQVAEQALRDATTSAGQRLVEAVKSRKMPDFPYSKFQRANERERESLWRTYVSSRLEADPEVKAAQARLLQETRVIPVALELGMVLLQHGRTLSD